MANLLRVDPVLLVEDDADAGEALREALAAAGHSVVLVGSAEEGFAALERAPFSAVILDLQLPDLGGVDLLERLRSDARFAGLPAVVHTSLPVTASLRARLASAGAVVQKSGRPDSVLAALERALAGAPAVDLDWLREP